MENATYIALSRLDTQDRAMSVVANNIANGSTAGFKAEHTLFSDYLVHQTGNNTAPGGEIEAYTQDRATYQNHAQGEFQQTGNPLDIAIGGDGFFQIKTSEGTRLSRSGRFERMSDGTITDESANPLLGQDNQPIRIDPADKTITIASDGTISTESGIAGKIGIVTPQDANQLHAEGSKLFRADTKTTPLETPHLMQGAIESSNVQMMTEMTHMLDIQRNFQFLSQFVDSESTRQQDAISKIVQTQA